MDDLGRLAIGNQVHLVGHLGGNLVHRRSADDGVTWTAPVTVAAATGNFPAMYGGLAAEGDTVFLITASSDMASSAGSGGLPLSFRKSTDNGATWTTPVSVTTTPIFRARIAARGAYVHVAGVSNPTSNPTYWYFRSTNGGTTWSAFALASNLGTYGGGQTIAVDASTGTVHVAYTDANGSVGAGPTWYRRSTDNGATWGTAQVLPGDTGIDRNHHHVWLAPGGGVHVIWRHGDSGDTVNDPCGYLRSTDYGATWGVRSFAIDTTATLGANHPWSVVANANAVHVLAGPSGTMQLASRPLP